MRFSQTGGSQDPAWHPKEVSISKGRGLLSEQALGFLSLSLSWSTDIAQHSINPWCENSLLRLNPWVLGGFPRTIRCWEAAGLVAKLYPLGLWTHQGMENQLAKGTGKTMYRNHSTAGPNQLRTSASTLTRKSMPTVEMKVPARKAPSLKRTSRQVFPTPESPTSMT